MHLRPSDTPLLRKTKWVTQALILSGTLNIGLLATFIYFAIKDKQQHVAIELTPLPSRSANSSFTNEQLLHAYALLPYQELLLRLENKDLIEVGLAKRDLALACLVAFHHFNLEKALGNSPLQKRILPFFNQNNQEKIELTVYPGLTDEHFHAIQQYSKTEKWPLTTQGLFYELKRAPQPRDPSLIDAFTITTEYHTLFTLFAKTSLPLSHAQLIDLLCDGDWSTFAQFTSERQAIDLSLDYRRSLLLSYLKHHSTTAAQLLLNHDREFLLKRLDDSSILTLLDLLDPQTPQLDLLAKELLASPRTDAIWKKSAHILYTLSGELLPEPYDHQASLHRFLFATAPSKPTPQPKPTTPKTGKRIHVVQAGDSLWKIAHKYHVTVPELMRANHLETEKLRLGRELEIPQK